LHVRFVVGQPSQVTGYGSAEMGIYRWSGTPVKVGNKALTLLLCLEQQRRSRVALPT
jgi:hypothetical protein